MGVRGVILASSWHGCIQMRFPFNKMNLSVFSRCVDLKRSWHDAASLTVADTVNISPYPSLPYWGKESGFADYFMTFSFTYGSKAVQVWTIFFPWSCKSSLGLWRLFVSTEHTVQITALVGKAAILAAFHGALCYCQSRAGHRCVRREKHGLCIFEFGLQ